MKRKTRKPNVLSLFDGISTGQFVLRKNLGIDCNYYASEIEESTIKCTMHHFPNTVQLGDVTKINTNKLPIIDLLIGGNPCQGFSFAGQRLAFNDPRSKLFFEFVKIYRALRKVNPNIYFFLENVVMAKKHQNVISKYLEVEPIYVDSALFSAQSRKRLYWTNIPQNTLPEKNSGLMMIDILEEPYYKPTNIGVKGTTKTNRQSSKIINIYNKCGTILTQNGGGRGGLNIPTSFYESRKATRNELERLFGLPDGYTKECGSYTKSANALGNGWEANTITFLFKNLKQLL